MEMISVRVLSTVCTCNYGRVAVCFSVRIFSKCELLLCAFYRQVDAVISCNVMNILYMRLIETVT